MSWLNRTVALFFILVVNHVWTQPVEGQWKPTSQPGQKVFRLMGHGFSSGYHWRTPGHRGDYYNPYSPANSNLESRSAYSNHYFMGGRQSHYHFPTNGHSQGSAPAKNSLEFSNGQSGHGYSQPSVGNWTRNDEVIPTTRPPQLDRESSGSDSHRPGLQRRPATRPTDEWPFEID